jgi:cytochrome P450
VTETTELPAGSHPIADLPADLHDLSWFDRMREQGPVHRLALPDGAVVWLITRYADVRAALADSRLSLDKRHARGWRGFALPPALDANLLNMDGPDHSRIRRLVTQAFTPRRVDVLRPRIRQAAGSLLDAIADQGRADLIAAYAGPLPIAVICDLLGIPTRDRADFRCWTNTMLATPPEPPAVRAAIGALHGFLTALIAAKRRAPGDDLLSFLIAARDSDDRLSEDELTSLAFLILFAGYENSVNLIGTAALHLLTHRGRTADTTALVDELMRVEPPAPVSIRRFPVVDVTIGGTTIAAGETVLLALAAANRDPARFGDPVAFDADRPDNAHLSLGHGVHYCLGAALARAEAEIAVEVLVARLPKLALAGQVSWRPSFRTRGLATLPVTF